MNNTKFIGLFAVMAMMAIGLTAAPIYGQAQTFRDQNQFPVSYYIYNSCTNENMVMDGIYQYNYQEIQTPNGGYKYNVNYQYNLNGESGGVQYQYNQNSQYGFTTQPGAAQTYQSHGTYRIISSGSTDNLIGQYTYKVTTNANGEITHFDIDFGTPKCVG